MLDKAVLANVWVSTFSDYVKYNEIKDSDFEFETLFSYR